jgi:hypothetical protein
MIFKNSNKGLFSIFKKEKKYLGVVKIITRYKIFDNKKNVYNTNK